MNKKQTLILWIAIIIIVWMGIMPPICVSSGPMKGLFTGFRPIFQTLASGQSVTVAVGIDLTRLFIEWFLVALMAAGLIYSLRSR